MLFIVFCKLIIILIFFNCSIKSCICLEETVFNDTLVDLKNANESKNEILNDTTANSVQSQNDGGQDSYNCPYYTHKKEKTKKDLTNFLKDSYDIATELCNTSSRVGCKYSDFLNLVSDCLNDKFFGVTDVIDELSENKELNELPQINNQPVVGFVSFKIVNVDTISIVKMDFKIDFYLAVTWDITMDNDFFRKYMARICVSKKVDMEKKQRLLLYQEDMKLFWVPDLYFPNSKSNAQNEKNEHLKRPKSRDLLNVSFRRDAFHKYPFLRFIFVTSGHSTILCPMKFDDYPADVQQCVVKIRSFYYYQDELRLVWSFLLYDNLQLLEYSVNVSKGQDLEEDHFVVTAGDQNKNFTRLNIYFNFTRHLTHKITGVYIPSLLLVSLNYLTYYFGVNSYPSRSSIGIMVLLTLTIMFSKVRNELPGSNNISGMEIWLIFCFICDVLQLIEASIAESIYTNNCIDFYLRKKEKKKLETEYLGYSYSVLFDDTSDEDEDPEEHVDNRKHGPLVRFLLHLIDLIVHLILPSFSKKKPEYYAMILDNIFRLLGPIGFSILCIWYWLSLLK